MADAAATTARALVACLRGEPPSRVDWAALIGQANDALVTPTLHQKLGGAPGVPSDVRDYLAMLHARNLRRNQRLRIQLFETARALNSEGVIPLVIKGAAHLVSRDAPMFSGRMLTDIDLVIEAAEAPRALEALRREGYTANDRDQGEHAVASLFRASDVGEVDLHVRPPGPHGLFEMAALRSRARRAVDHSGALEVPSATDLSAITIVHDMLHEHGLLRAAVDLRRLLDVAVWTTTEEGCDWTELVQRFSGRRTARWSVEVTARTLAEWLRVEIKAPLSAASRLLHARQNLLAASPRLAAADRSIRPLAHRAWLAASKRLGA